MFFHIKAICGGFSLVSAMKYLHSPTRTQKIIFLRENPLLKPTGK